MCCFIAEPLAGRLQGDCGRLLGQAGAGWGGLGRAGRGWLKCRASASLAVGWWRGSCGPPSEDAARRGEIAAARLLWRDCCGEIAAARCAARRRRRVATAPAQRGRGNAEMRGLWRPPSPPPAGSTEGAKPGVSPSGRRHTQCAGSRDAEAHGEGQCAQAICPIGEGCNPMCRGCNLMCAPGAMGGCQGTLGLVGGCLLCVRGRC